MTRYLGNLVVPCPICKKLYPYIDLPSHMDLQHPDTVAAAKARYFADSKKASR